MIAAGTTHTIFVKTVPKTNKQKKKTASRNTVRDNNILFQATRRAIFIPQLRKIKTVRKEGQNIAKVIYSASS